MTRVVCLSVQLVHANAEHALQQRLEEVSAELKASQQEAAAVSGQCFPGTVSKNIPADHCFVFPPRPETFSDSK